MSGANGAGDTGNFYEVLGIAEGATPEEVKRAYYRLVRQHRPSEQPELFQRYNDAHRILGDKRRRGAYDQNRRAGRRVQALQDQAAAVLEKDAQKAMMLLKSAIALAPDLPRPRTLLAQVMVRIADYEGAERQFVWLIADSPRDEGIRVKFARCLLLQERYGEAEAHLQEALRVNPLHYDALIWLARVYDADGRMDDAAAVLRRAISNDGAENISDLDALMRLFALYFRHGRTEDAASLERRIRGVFTITDQGERYERGIRQLCRRARELYQNGEDAAATVLASLAESIANASDEIDEAVQNEARSVARFTTLMRDARRVMEDSLVEGALRECIRLKYLDHSPDETRGALMDGLLTDIQEEITADPKRLGAAIEYLRREYADIAADQSAFLGELIARIVRRLQILGPDGKYDNAGPSGPTAMPGMNPSSAGNARKGGLVGWLRGGK